jgi:NitT/TauT family transport system substrate-binding protein
MGRVRLVPRLLILMAVTGFAVAGCGGADETTAPPVVGTEDEGLGTPDETENEETEPEEAIALTVQAYPGSQISLPLYLGVAEGFFAEHGLDVDIVEIPSAPEAFQALFGGSIDVMATSPSVTWTAASERGTGDIRFVLGSIGPLYYSVVGSTEVDWPDGGGTESMVEALTGRTVGVTALGADTMRVLEGLFGLYGRSPDSVTFVAVGIGPSSIAALEGNQVDAIVAAPPAQDILVARGAGEMLVDFREGAEIHEAYEPWAFAQYVSTEGLIDQKLEGISRFQAAMVDIVDYIQAEENLQAVVDFFVETTEGLSPEEAEVAMTNFRPLYTTMVDCAALANTATYYIEHAGTLQEDQVPPCEEFYWEGVADFVILE